MWDPEVYLKFEAERTRPVRDLLSWMRGTGLPPVLAALEVDPAAREEFLATYRDALRRAYPPDPAGRTPMPFRRLFVVARKMTPGQVPRT